MTGGQAYRDLNGSCSGYVQCVSIPAVIIQARILFLALTVVFTVVYYMLLDNKGYSETLTAIPDDRLDGIIYNENCAQRFIYNDVDEDCSNAISYTQLYECRFAGEIDERYVNRDGDVVCLNSAGNSVFNSVKLACIMAFINLPFVFLPACIAVNVLGIAYSRKNARMKYAQLAICLLCTSVMDGWFQMHRYLNINNLNVMHGYVGWLHEWGTGLSLTCTIAVILALFFYACRATPLLYIASAVAGADAAVCAVFGLYIKIASLRNLYDIWDFSFDVGKPEVIMVFDTTFMILCAITSVW